jgi:hypothetical protein
VDEANPFSPGFELLVCYDMEEDRTLPALSALSADDKPPVALVAEGKAERVALEPRRVEKRRRARRRAPRERSMPA